MTSSPPTHNIGLHEVSGPNHECLGQDQGDDGPSSSGSAMHTDENEDTVITRIRVTDVTLGFRRIPAGFYAVAHHGGREWRTEIKHSSIDNNVLEWGRPIPLPSDRSATVCLGTYASFEFQPVLGRGEELRKLTVTVQQLLDRSAQDVPFRFFPKDGDVVSPCSSLLVTVGRQKRDRGDSSVSRDPDPNCSTTRSWGKLEDTTNQGHSALSRYRKHGERRDLDVSIEHFERAVDICPLDHPCRAAVQANIAQAKLIRCRVDTDHSLEVPLMLYRNALGSRPIGHPDRSCTLVQLATVHLTRFEKWEDEDDSALAEGLLGEVIDLSTPDSHENRAANFMLQLHTGRKMGAIQEGGQSSVEQDSASRLTAWDPLILGIQLVGRFEQFGGLGELQQAILQFEACLRSTSVWGQRYIAGQTNLGVALLYRFNQLGELSDLEQAMSGFGIAVDLTPDCHPDKPTYLNNLGNCFLTRFERIGELGDLEQAISKLRDAVDLTPDRYPHKPTCLNNLGNCFRARFWRIGELGDLEQAISKLRDAVDLTPDRHPHKPSYLSNLGNCFLTRFKRIGELGDLEQAISTLRDAVDLTSDRHPDKPGRLSSLGDCFLTRFDRIGELGDLEQAISTLRNTLDLTPDRHPHKPRCLSSLGDCFRARFERIGELCDLEQAISKLGDAVDLTPDRHPDKPVRLNNLGNCFLTRFWRIGELGNLEQAISKLRDAVDLTPDRHPHKPSYLNNLGNCFLTRFKRIGELGDLEQAISTLRDAVDLTPDRHPDKPHCLSSLGSCFLTRFERIGELGDLGQAISKLRDAVDLTPDRHPDKPGRLNNLGNCFLTRFERIGELGDLEQAISKLRDAVDLTPDRHPHKPDCLSNLGNCFLTRFERIGELGDLEQAISRVRDAVDLTPDRHPDKPGRLNNLGNCFLARFKRIGELGDLEQAISRVRDAVDLTPDRHPDKPSYLSNLGSCSLTRFSRIGELGDLEQAISMLRNTLDLTPDRHPHKPACLNNLGKCFRARFQRLGELGDLEQAISKHRDAVDLTPDRHPHKPGRLNNLGNCFLTRFERIGELGDLEQAISTLRDAVDLTPDRHPAKPSYLNNVGHYFFTRFEHLGELHDLEQAISRVRDAVDLTPDRHPHKPSYLSNLGNCFRARFSRLGESRDLGQATSLYSDAACASTGSTTVRFGASRSWILCARASGHLSLLHAHSVAIGLLPHLAWIGLPLANRYSELIQGADVVREAAAAALDKGDPQTAVEWLEQGRSIVWGELFQLRSSYDELASVHPNLARRLQDLSAALEHSGAARETLLSSLSEQPENAEHRAPESLEQQADRHRALAIERDILLRDIRTFPGFERFLLQKKFSQLRASAHSGPVAVLNAAESRCDALIVLADAEDVLHVPLPGFTLDRSERLQNALKNLLPRAIPSDEREGKRAERKNVTWESVLSILWNNVVKPVLDALAFSTPGELSRIFWCPTGPFAFLPIHAAGLYGTQSLDPGHKVSDFVISSYIPTLSILVPSPETNTPSSDHLRLLTVRQPLTDGQTRLPGVNIELERIRNVIQSSPSARTTLLESSIGTVEEVLSLMREADWVHFACHGTQDTTNPTESGLCLANQRRLKLSDIIALSRPRGGLAFLSACETAMGDKDLSDEALHIAAGMLFAGYGGVVGTMWSISDSLAPLVAKDVYQQLFQNRTRPDYREAARALHHAVGRLRDNRASFVEWLPFIHVGL